MKETEILNDFAIRIKEQFTLSATLFIDESDFDLFQNFYGISDIIIQFPSKKFKSDKEIVIEDSIQILTQLDSDYDFILGNLPFGMSQVPLTTDLNFKVNKNWKTIYLSLFNLSKNGKALFLVEPSIIYTISGKNFFQTLKENGFYLNAVFNPPAELLKPQTALQPILILLSMSKSEKLFIAELEDGNIERVISNLPNYNTPSKNLNDGIFVRHDDFKSFFTFKTNRQIEKLKTQYKEFTQFKLKDLSTEINLTRTNFKDRPNCVYIPKIGTKNVVSRLENITLKHQYYFQVVLKESIVNANYLELFYKSDLGKLSLKSLTTNIFPLHINKNDIEDCIIAIPDLEEQKLIIQTYSKLSRLESIINDLKTELSLNPKNSKAILYKFDDIEKPLLNLSEEDKILNLIRKGESKQLEFKQTFSKAIGNEVSKKNIQKSSLKNIVGFLNADGGTLLIGVSDDGTTTGIEDDFYQTDDRYLLNFKNALNTKIGAEFYPHIEYNIHPVQSKKILRVDCSKSNEPCFYDEKEFFVRTNPATDKLEGKKLMEYIRKRFGS
jgi:hypothetical protein